MKARELVDEAAALTRRVLGELAAELRTNLALDDARARSRRLVALQFDRDVRDHELARGLIEAETRAEAAGDTPTMLDLAAFLLSGFADADDLGRFVRAKQASFDTRCGFDREYLFSAGLAPALAALARLDEAERTVAAGLMLEDGAPAFAEAALAAWRRAKAAWYPEDWRDEDVGVLVAHAIVWGERAWGSALLDALEAGGGASLSLLALQRGRLGEHERAAAARLAQAAAEVKPFERAGALVRAAASLLAAGRVDEAAATLARAIAPLREDVGWWRVGLGHQLVSTGFAIAAALPPGERAAHELASYDALARLLKWTPLELLERAVLAAARHGRADLEAHYRAAAAAEAERIRRP